jgi:hypothetical protein
VRYRPGLLGTEQSARTREGSAIVTRHFQLVRARLACLVLAVGLGGIAGGCGGTTGPGTAPEGEKAPEGIVKLKEAMKERAAAKKGGPGGRARAPGAH